MLRFPKNHESEFVRSIRNHQWERTDDGAIYFPEQRAVGQGIWGLSVNGGPREWFKNLWSDEGCTYLLNLLGNHVALVSWYISLYANAITPIAAWTAASYPATASEITSGSEGYTQGARVQWTTVLAVTPALNNYAAPAVYTIATATTLAVNGLGVHSVATKGATTGALFSAARFPAVKNFSAADEFDLKYQATLAGV